MLFESSIEVRLATKEDLERILELHKEQKRWLGFMPDKPFEDAVVDGRILVAELAGTIVGYLMYRLRLSTNDASVVHVAVSDSQGRRGAGTALVQSLVDACEGRSRITLKCRNDFHRAHAFWRSVGFEAIAESAGRSADGHVLTTFERRLHRQPSLLDGLYQDSEPFCVDLDVLIDLATDRKQGEITREVFLQLDQFDVHPLRTTALSNELSLHGDEKVRKRARSIALGWQEADEVAGDQDRSDLVCRVGGVDSGDMKHLADAERNGISVLLSRDEAFSHAVRASGRPGTSVRVMTPAEFIDQLAMAEDPGYRPGLVAGMAVVNASEFGAARLVRDFLRHGAGEKKTHMRARLDSRLASLVSEVCCVVREGSPICIFAFTRGEGNIACDLLRVLPGPGAVSVARHALALIRRSATGHSGAGVVVVEDPYLPLACETALKQEGFSPVDAAWVAVAVRSGSLMNAVSDVRDLEVPDIARPVLKRAEELLAVSDTDTRAAAEAEHVLDPLVIVDSALPTILVPIQARWSDRLIGRTPSQLDIDTTDSALRTFREHVYFRSPSGMRVLPDSRVFWYRTGERPSRVFATSVVEFAAIRETNEIWGRFGAYGVLQRHEVESTANRGKAMAIKFCRTRRLREEVTLERLQKEAERRGVAVKAAPRGPMRLDPQLARWMLGSEIGLE